MNFEPNDLGNCVHGISLYAFSILFPLNSFHNIFIDNGIQNNNLYPFVFRELTNGNPSTCGSNVDTETCSPTTIPDTCIQCIHDDKFYSVGEIISVQDEGCTLW